jgi:uncharacterized protein YjdB
MKNENTQHQDNQTQTMTIEHYTPPGYVPNQFDSKRLEVSLGQTEKLAAISETETIPFNQVTWESDNPQILEIDQNGRATGINLGKVLVKVTHTQTGKFGESEISVIGIKY